MSQVENAKRKILIRVKVAKVMANEKNLLDFPRTTTALSSDFIHISQGGVDKKISLPDFTSDLNEGNQYNITVREETSTSRTLTLADKNSYIRCLNGSTTTITVISLGAGGWKLGDYLRYGRLVQEMLL